MGNHSGKWKKEEFSSTKSEKITILLKLAIWMMISIPVLFIVLFCFVYLGLQEGGEPSLKGI